MIARTIFHQWCSAKCNKRERRRRGEGTFFKKTQQKKASLQSFPFYVIAFNVNFLLYCDLSLRTSSSSSSCMLKRDHDDVTKNSVTCEIFNFFPSSSIDGSTSNVWCSKGGGRWKKCLSIKRLCWKLFGKSRGFLMRFVIGLYKKGNFKERQALKINLNILLGDGTLEPQNWAH